MTRHLSTNQQQSAALLLVSSGPQKSPASIDSNSSKTALCQPLLQLGRAEPPADAAVRHEAAVGREHHELRDALHLEATHEALALVILRDNAARQRRMSE